MHFLRGLRPSAVILGLFKEFESDLAAKLHKISSIFDINRCRLTSGSQANIIPLVAIFQFLEISKSIKLISPDEAISICSCKFNGLSHRQRLPKN
jgi:hypothetical protein